MDEQDAEKRAAHVVPPGMIPEIPDLGRGIPPLTDEQFAQVQKMFEQQFPAGRGGPTPEEFQRKLAELSSDEPPTQQPGQGPAYGLAARMAELGAPDPNRWARSELSKDIPQEARWLFIKLIWQNCIENSGLRNPHAEQLQAAGVDERLLAKALKLAAWEG